MWTPVNVDISSQNIDSILGINGLCKLVTQKISKDTFCKFNIHCASEPIGPNGFDRYILGFWFEVLDENVFIEFYKNNPQAEFVILSDMLPNDLVQLPRCKHVRLMHWKWFMSQHDPKSQGQSKKYKIGSLSNRVNQYKFFVTAKLLDKSDVCFTWNALYYPNISYEYIFSPTGWPNRDRLLAHTETLRHPINQENFNNDPGQSFSQDSVHPAYAESLVNLINETKDNSWHTDLGVLPGPYITEKTWKPLILGNALLFSGQHNIKKVLQEVGFQFEYPWIDAYSHLPGDLERLDRLLDTIDTVLSMTLHEIEAHTRESILHNQNHIRSGQVHRLIDEKNKQALDQLAGIL